MALDDRNPQAGTIFAANYKKQRYTCTVVASAEGIRFKLEDGREFKTPSAAASALMGGMAANGWRFWSLASELDAPKPAKERTARTRKVEPTGEGEAAATVKLTRVIAPTPDQTGVPAGKVRYWCLACADSFTVPASVEPQGCPNGHAAEAPNGELQTVETPAEVERVADPFEGQAAGVEA